MNDRLGIGTTAPVAKLDIETDAAAEVGMQIMLAASQSADAFQVLDSSATKLLAIDEIGQLKFFEAQTATIASNFTAIDITGTLNCANGSIIGFTCTPTINISSPGPGFGLLGIFFNYQPTINITLASALWSPPLAYSNTPAIIADGVANTAASLFPGFRDQPQFSVSNGGTWSNTSTWTSYLTGLTLTGAGTTWGTRIGYKVNDSTGTGSIVTQVGLDVATLTKATNNYAIRTGASGEIRFGNKITLYNNIATVSNGVPSEVATVDLATQGAAIGATTIYTPTATGSFRVSCYLQVTRAATTSSTLGTVTITYNDGDGNVAQSVVMALENAAGATATSATTNTTATNLNGEMYIYARTGVAIQYAIGYASSGATSMQYAAHLKVEAL